MEQSQAPQEADATCWPVRVYYEDTDAGGVVYYANYLKYCERARTEWLRQSGFQQAQLLAERNLAFVVRSVQAEFIRPAGLDDCLQVQTLIEKMGRASIGFRQRIMRADTLLFEAGVLVACVNLAKMKTSPIPQDMYERMITLQHRQQASLTGEAS